jgi:hypothetical protein
VEALAVVPLPPALDVTDVPVNWLRPGAALHAKTATETAASTPTRIGAPRAAPVCPALGLDGGVAT